MRGVYSHITPGMRAELVLLTVLATALPTGEADGGGRRANVPGPAPGRSARRCPLSLVSQIVRSHVASVRSQAWQLAAVATRK
jgi:hypothetical protein